MNTVQTSQVTDVTDHGTLLLSDGRMIRLSGLLLPRAPASFPANRKWPDREKAVSDIRKLLGGKNIRFWLTEKRTDRYGIWPAHIYTLKGGRDFWVQRQLLEQGNARVIAMEGQTACIPQLLQAEDQARRQGKGIWNNSTYSIRSAGDTENLIRQPDSYQIVEGTVRAIAVVRGRTYLNFGTDWKTDFTVRISGRNLGLFRQFGQEPSGYVGRQIRVRGWIQDKNGPLIEIDHPHLIEVSGTEQGYDKNITDISTDW